MQTEKSSRGSSYRKLQGGAGGGGGDAKSTVDTFLPATDKQVLGIPSTGEGPAVKHELISSKNALTLFGTFRHGAENSLALRLVCAVTGGGRENGGRRAGTAAASAGVATRGAAGVVPSATGGPVISATQTQACGR